MVLVAFIVLSISTFCLIFSSLNLNQATAWLKKMQLLSSAAFSLGHGGNDSQSNGVSQQLLQFISTLVVLLKNRCHLGWMLLPNDEGAFKMPV
jgi:PiT family inorganic phosphate transporter